jgi:hypothetical protein
MRDVSERMKFERELQETQKLESLGLLGAEIVHNFNDLLEDGSSAHWLVVSRARTHVPDEPDHRLMHCVLIVRRPAIFSPAEVPQQLLRRGQAWAGLAFISVESGDPITLSSGVWALWWKGIQRMTITLPLDPQKEAKLRALAQEKGITAEDLVRDVVDHILSEAPGTSPRKEPTRSLRGILAKYGPAPSADEIDQNRAEMFANFPHSDLWWLSP